MFSINLFGYEIYYLLLWFWIYSFLGWCFESTYSSFHYRKILNRGFVYLPFCSIYGVGALIIIIILSPLKFNLFYLFVSSIILTSMLEYVVFIVLKKIFNQIWWDYSDLKFHYKGILSLESSLAWGVLSTLLLVVIHPFIQKLVMNISKADGIKIIIVITFIYLIDFIRAVTVAYKKSKT